MYMVLRLQAWRDGPERAREGSVTIILQIDKIDLIDLLNIFVFLD